MKLYLKILSAIIFVSIFFALSLTALLWLLSLINNSGTYGIGTPLLFAWIGFIIFGLPNSIFWFITYQFTAKTNWSEIKKHNFSVLVAILITALFLYIYQPFFVMLLVFVIPVAVSILFDFKMMYLPR